MKIFSVANNCWLTIESRKDRNGYSGIEIESHADIGHGQFNAKNIDVQFLNLEEFVTALDRFINDRNLIPRLEGTYETYISFTTSGTAVLIQDRIGDAFSGRKTAYFYQSGEFEIEQ